MLLSFFCVHLWKGYSCNLWHCDLLLDVSLTPISSCAVKLCFLGGTLALSTTVEGTDREDNMHVAQGLVRRFSLFFDSAWSSNLPSAVPFYLPLCGVMSLNVHGRPAPATNFSTARPPGLLPNQSRSPFPIMITPSRTQLGRCGQVGRRKDLVFPILSFCAGTPVGGFQVGRCMEDCWYFLHLETAETLFYLWRITHDQKYRDWSWELAQVCQLPGICMFLLRERVGVHICISCGYDVVQVCVWTCARMYMGLCVCLYKNVT